MVLDISPIRSLLMPGEMKHQEISIPVTISVTYQLHDSEPVTCKVLALPDNLPSGFVPPYEVLGSLEGSETQIWIPEFPEQGRISSTPPQWESVAPFYVEGDLEEFEPSDGYLLCEVFLPPSPIACWPVLWKADSDGRLSPEYPHGHQGITWSLPLGNATLVDRFSSIEGKIDTDDIRVRRHRLQIRLEIQSLPDKISLGRILYELQENLEDSLWLLSFLGMKRLAWHEAKAWYFPKKDSTASIRSAIARRRIWGGRIRSLVDDPWDRNFTLVRTKTLADGLFQKLQDNYRASEFKDAILRTIVNLLMSTEEGYLESHLNSAYSALETLGSGVKKLRNTSLTNKVMPLVSEFCLDKYLKEIWPPNTDIRSAINEIRVRRNVFIHGDRIDDWRLHQLDLRRLQTLCELYILRKLGCPESAIQEEALPTFLKDPMRYYIDP